LTDKTCGDKLGNNSKGAESNLGAFFAVQKSESETGMEE